MRKLMRLREIMEIAQVKQLGSGYINLFSAVVTYTPEVRYFIKKRCLVHRFGA